MKYCSGNKGHEIGSKVKQGFPILEFSIFDNLCCD